MFIEDKDMLIADIIWNYFDAVKERWPIAWNSNGQGNILNKTNGFRALMRYLRPAYLNLGKPGDIISKEMFMKLFKRISIKDNEFTTEIYHPGTAGESKLYNTLIDESKI
jgi:hypothetical protein